MFMFAEDRPFIVEITSSQAGPPLKNLLPVAACSVGVNLISLPFAQNSAASGPDVFAPSDAAIVKTFAASF